MKNLIIVLTFIAFGFISCENKIESKQNIEFAKFAYIEKEYEFGGVFRSPKSVSSFHKNYSFSLVDYPVGNIAEFFILLSDDGDTIFCKEAYLYGESNSDFEIMADSSIIVSRKYVRTDPLDTYSHIYKFDKNWNTIWDKKTQQNSQPYSKPLISLTNDGGILVASGIAYMKTSIVKLDSEGNFVWESIIDEWDGLLDLWKNEQGEHFIEIITKNDLVGGIRVNSETKTYQINDKTGNFNLVKIKKENDSILIDKKLNNFQITIKKDSLRKNTSISVLNLETLKNTNEVLFNTNNVVINDIFYSKHQVYFIVGGVEEQIFITTLGANGKVIEIKLFHEYYRNIISVPSDKNDFLLISTKQNIQGRHNVLSIIYPDIPSTP